MLSTRWDVAHVCNQKKFPREVLHPKLEASASMMEAAVSKTLRQEKHLHFFNGPRELHRQVQIEHQDETQIELLLVLRKLIRESLHLG